MEFKALLLNLSNNGLLMAILYVALSFIGAYILDRILIGLLRKIMMKSTTDLDDKILETLHRPLYFSILFFGFSIAIELLLNTYKLDSSVSFIVNGLLSTAIIIIWSLALFRSFIILIQWALKKSRQNSFIQAKTIPLFETIGKIVLFLTAIYL